MSIQQIDKILKYWFGHVEETIVPSESLAKIWFSDSLEVDQDIKTQFSEDVEKAIHGDYANWEKDVRGQLALIILLDQFSRHIYRDSSKAYSQDSLALKICLEGRQKEWDHELTLMERVFYYFPLLHSEELPLQQQGLQAYQELVEYSLPETRIIYESFFKFANHHYTIVQRFGRFPQRNRVLNRESTHEELEFLKEYGLQ